MPSHTAHLWSLVTFPSDILPLYNLPRFSVQSLSRVRLFATPWTIARQASLSITNSQSPPKPMSIESVMPSNHLILCRPLLLLPSIFPSIRVFSNQLFASGGQSIGVSASVSVLSKNTQYWSPLGWTGWISLQSKGLSRVFSNDSTLWLIWPGSFPCNTLYNCEYNRLQWALWVLLANYQTWE